MKRVIARHGRGKKSGDDSRPEHPAGDGIHPAPQRPVARPGVALHRPAPRRPCRRRGRRPRRPAWSSTSAPAPAACGRPTDGGTYWENVSDGYFGTAAVGALAVAHSDPNVIYAGTGETTHPRQRLARRRRVPIDRRRHDLAATSAWRDTRHIAQIRVHPHNPDLVYVAALGHAWGPNRERGVYRSRDGGKHLGAGAVPQRARRRHRPLDGPAQPAHPLRRVLGGAALRPTASPAAGQAAACTARPTAATPGPRSPHRPGLPTGVMGKIGVAVSPAQSGRVWALVEAEDGALFRSDDGGETWERVCEERRPAHACLVLHARLRRPAGPRDGLGAQPAVWKSTDGGRTFSAVPTPHGDNHDLWIDPRNPQRMIEGNDGGACVSFNGGATWSSIYNQPTAQFYHVTTDDQVPYRVYGSQQDNTAISAAQPLRHAGRSPRPSGTSRAAARAATSPSGPTTRTSSSPGRSAAARATAA